MISSTPVFLPLSLDNASDGAALPHAGAERVVVEEGVKGLTAGLRAGQEAAYRQLYAGWNGRLARYCFVLARGDGAFAGELVQAVYLRVARHMRPLPDADALWAWLARAARCAASDLRRTGGRYGRALERFAEWLGRTGEPAPMGEEACEERALAALDHALGALSLEQRRLIELRYFDGHSLDEIGRLLHLTPRAVEGRLARLRGELRTVLKHELSRANGP